MLLSERIGCCSTDLGAAGSMRAFFEVACGSIIGGFSSCFVWEEE
jgi:hypothetical protein